MLTTTSATSAPVTTAFKTLGLELPKPVRDAVQQARRVREYLDQLTTGDVVPSTLDTLAAGRDPIDAPAVQRAAAVAVLTERRGSITEAASQRIVDAIRDSAPEATEAIQQSAQAPIDDVHEALDALGNIDLDADAIIRRGPEAAAHWARIEAAEALVPHWVTAWRGLNAPQVGNVNPALIWCAATPELADDPEFRRQPTLWQAARAGVELGIATPDEYLKRARLLARAKQEAAARAEAERERALNSFTGVRIS